MTKEIMNKGEELLESAVSQQDDAIENTIISLEKHWSSKIIDEIKKYDILGSFLAAYHNIQFSNEDLFLNIHPEFKNIHSAIYKDIKDSFLLKGFFDVKNADSKSLDELSKDNLIMKNDLFRNSVFQRIISKTFVDVAIEYPNHAILYTQSMFDLDMKSNESSVVTKEILEAHSLIIDYFGKKAEELSKKFEDDTSFNLSTLSLESDSIGDSVEYITSVTLFQVFQEENSRTESEVFHDDTFTCIELINIFEQIFKEFFNPLVK